MAKKSEELIEKPVVSKRGRPRKNDKKISKPKKSESLKTTATEINIAEPIVDVETVEEKIGTIVENTTNTSANLSVSKPKRTIKNISVKKSNSEKGTTSKIETETITKKKVPSSKRGVILSPKVDNAPELIVAPKNNKRTLKLNLETRKPEIPEVDNTVVEEKETINQNSAFFNRPSIFDKFNIDITNLDSEETAISSTDTDKHPIEEPVLEEVSETEIIEDILDEELTETNPNETSDLDLVLEILSENTNDEITLSDENEIINESTTSDENEVEDETSIFNTLSLEDLENLDNLDLTFEDEININSDVEEILDEQIDNSIEDDFYKPENSSVDFSDVEENEIEIDTTLEEQEELKEVADTITIEEPTTQKGFSDTAIGKFFDSSIPNVTSTVNNTFSKIKKSIFNNMSPIFKKFTFEEASLVNNSKQQMEETVEETFVKSGNNLTDIQKALENFVPNVEPEIVAEPVATIPVAVDTDTTIDFSNYETDMSTDFSNVITPLSESSYEADELLNDAEADPEEYNFSNKLIDKLISEAEKIEENKKEDSENNYKNITSEDLEKLNQDSYDDETFSIEAYFGLDKEEPVVEPQKEENTNNIEEEVPVVEEELTSEEFVNKFLEVNSTTDEEIQEETIDNENPEVENNVETDLNNDTNNELEDVLKEKDLEISNLSKLLEKYSETISSLSTRLTNLENKTFESPKDEEIDIDDIQIDDLDISLDDLTETTEEIQEEPSLLPTDNETEESAQLVENLLSEAFLAKDIDLEGELKNELLSEVLSYEENSDETDIDEKLLESALIENLSEKDLIEEKTELASENTSDFFKIIDSLTKAITELEQAPDIKQDTLKPIFVDELPNELISTVTEEKAINILINKDDIFSISILNETYEIVADFDGISVLSENIHISTPKNNFFVKVGNKYIEIHNKKDHFVLNTNFEDIEFANAINNIAFAKKNNKIELNIKEAFKLSSVNNKIELSMLNKSIADLSNASTSTTTQTSEESSICDNKTLLISEETQKVYLPYTIEDVMKKLRTSDEYQTVQDVVDHEYTLPLSTFKMPIISRFKEAYRFMRTKEKSSVYAAVDLAVELMFNSNLNPAVIRAAKDLKELNIYLDCLYENEIEKFDCFKIIYKVLPKIK